MIAVPDFLRNLGAGLAENHHFEREFSAKWMRKTGVMRFPVDPFGIPEAVSPKTPCYTTGFSANGIRLSGLISRTTV
ncbi:hypothetical protein [Blastochloris tepida]|uniref:hypothetical protein n=1 Tax=Blastochloris tepida TaxID=2233851 RepID=UPI000F84CD66|nr:hypothetical protein [Blastochloris tepida]